MRNKPAGRWWRAPDVEGTGDTSRWSSDGAEAEWAIAPSMAINTTDPSKARTHKHYKTEVVIQTASHKWSESNTDRATSQAGYNPVSTGIWFEGRTCCTGRRAPHQESHGGCPAEHSP